MKDGARELRDRIRRSSVGEKGHGLSGAESCLEC